MRRPECDSLNTKVTNETGDDVGDQAELECGDCGNIEVITRCDPEDYFNG